MAEEHIGLSLLLMIFMGGIVVAVVLLNRSRIERSEDVWRSVARGFGLTFYPGTRNSPTKIQGLHKGHEVELYADQMTPFNRTTTLRAYVNREMPKGFRVCREASMRGAKLLGAQDLRVGEPAFDDVALIQGEVPSATLRILKGSELPRALARAWKRYPATELNEFGVQTQASGMLSERGSLEALIETSVALATQLDEAAPVGAPRSVERVSRKYAYAEEILAAFKKTRMRTFTFGVLPCVVGIVVFALSTGGSGHVPNSVWRVLGVSCFVGGILAAVFLYRCPACGQLPSNPNQRGVPIFISECPRCGVLLSEE